VQHQEIILHLSLIEKVNSSTVLFLIEQLGTHRLPDLYNFSLKDFQVLGCLQKQAELLVAGLQDPAKLHKELALMREHHVGLVTIVCPQYPKILKEIHVPPVILYYQGDIQLFAHEKNIACVGARKAHRYANEALMHLIVPMMQTGWIVVSGGALGADTFAHQISLDHKVPTMVVVGSGLCHVYPPQNKKLFEQVIAGGGLIVSSFSMQTPPDPWNFPRRNRLISGLSRGCLVLQAAERSGALITAQCALDQGREVFAVPGSIFDELSAGCHSLIADGAKLVRRAQDILDELGYLEVAAKDDQQKLFIPAKSTGPVAELDQIALQILQVASTPITVDLMLSKLQLDVGILQNKLFELSLDGKIAQDELGFWKRA
jgi:DNA processing protein